MKAVRLHEYGGPEVLRYEDVPDPTPRGDQVVVRVRACAMNHLDLWVRKGTTRSPLPHILGSDIAGEVVEPGQVPAKVSLPLQEDVEGEEVERVEGKVLRGGIVRVGDELLRVLLVHGVNQPLEVSVPGCGFGLSRRDGPAPSGPSAGDTGSRGVVPARRYADG